MFMARLAPLISVALLKLVCMGVVTPNELMPISEVLLQNELRGGMAQEIANRLYPLVSAGLLPLNQCLDLVSRTYDFQHSSSSSSRSNGTSTASSRQDSSSSSNVPTAISIANAGSSSDQRSVKRGDLASPSESSGMQAPRISLHVTTRDYRMDLKELSELELPKPGDVFPSVDRAFTHILAASLRRRFATTADGQVITDQSGQPILLSAKELRHERRRNFQYEVRCTCPTCKFAIYLDRHAQVVRETKIRNLTEAFARLHSDELYFIKGFKYFYEADDETQKLFVSERWRAGSLPDFMAIGNKSLLSLEELKESEQVPAVQNEDDHADDHDRSQSPARSRTRKAAKPINAHERVMFLRGARLCKLAMKAGVDFNTHAGIQRLLNEQPTVVPTRPEICKFADACGLYQPLGPDEDKKDSVDIDFLVAYLQDIDPTKLALAPLEESRNKVVDRMKDLLTIPVINPVTRDGTLGGDEVVVQAKSILEHSPDCTSGDAPFFIEMRVLELFVRSVTNVTDEPPSVKELADMAKGILAPNVQVSRDILSKVKREVFGSADSRSVEDKSMSDNKQEADG